MKDLFILNADVCKSFLQLGFTLKSADVWTLDQNLHGTALSAAWKQQYSVFP